jgi:hypothetical protein
MGILSDLEPTKEELFQQRTRYHILLVQKYLDKIIQLKDPRLDASTLSAEKNHDESKFLPPEHDAYIEVNWMYHLKDHGQKYNPPPEIQKAMDIATLHHITTNKHHPEAWVTDTLDLNRKERVLDVTRMPLSYVAAMVADWLAMSREKGTDPYAWAREHIDKKWKFGENQKKLIYDLMKKVWEG